MNLRLAVIVEGHGECAAVPVLVRRIAAEISPDLALEVLPPIRVARQKVVRPGELERAVQLAAIKAGLMVRS